MAGDVFARCDNLGGRRRCRDAVASVTEGGLQRRSQPTPGHLERMHFTTGTEAVWDLRIALASSNGRRVTVSESYAFNWHFSGDYACREAATAMSVAVQSLVRKTVRHFVGLLEPSQQAAAAQPSSSSTAPTTPAVALAAPAPAN